MTLPPRHPLAKCTWMFRSTVGWCDRRSSCVLSVSSRPDFMSGRSGEWRRGRWESGKVGAPRAFIGIESERAFWRRTRLTFGIVFATPARGRCTRELCRASHSHVYPAHGLQRSHGCVLHYGRGAPLLSVRGGSDQSRRKSGCFVLFCFAFFLHQLTGEKDNGKSKLT